MKFLVITSIPIHLLAKTGSSIEHSPQRLRTSKTSLNHRERRAIDRADDIVGQEWAKFKAHDKLSFDMDGIVEQEWTKFKAHDKLSFDFSLDLAKGEGGMPTFNATRPPIAATEGCQQAVKCVGGYVDEAHTESCADACDGECCSGKLACLAFTGSVCKDGASCQKDFSCIGAKINDIYYGCQGPHACNNAGSGSGTSIDKVHDGCQGEYSCFEAGKDGIINEIVSSCQGNAACQDAGRDGGSIGTIRNSCSEYRACDSAGWTGEIGEIVDSCNGPSSCSSAVTYGGNIGTIHNSCSGSGACKEAG
eukprot:CAMPEP_0181121362 /NCGR_PEP_ID=MMETSP1071-20121207/24699_1 /TAXON_ID=35127 /ORGANISM="Thalassiosira sp., Strain NH16" /LENGTH=305 /DNA_ID=CAMNT_0023206179 /DNA_START=30 /DNA_END=943 /DNA_ORIENTATION=+